MKNEFRASKPSDQKEWNIPTEGLTKREYFAGLAMQGLLASNNGQSIDYLIHQSIKAADELLKQLENSNTKNQDDRN